MNWLGIGIALMAAYAGFKVISLLLRLALWLVALLALYWVCAPLLGWPTLSEWIQSPRPMLEAERIGAVVRDAGHAGERASDLAGTVLEKVAGVAEQVREQLDSDFQSDQDATEKDAEPMPEEPFEATEPQVIRDRER